MIAGGSSKMPAVRKHFVLDLYGTSLTQGRLNADWPALLKRQLQQYPEAKGPIDIVNQGKGSTNSDWGLANIGLIANDRPTHVLMEGFSINDAALTDGVNPQVTTGNHDVNVTAMVAALRAARADVDITIQTMNPVSLAGQGLRPNLAAYYARDVALAGTLGLTLLDNYGGVAGGPVGGWPKPIDGKKTNGAAPFLIAPTGGYAGQWVNALWDPAHVGANIAISADGLSFTSTGVGGVRDLTAIAGQSHVEFTIGAVGGGFALGVCNGAMNVADYPGQDLNGFGLGSSGSVYRNGAVVANAGLGGAVGAGDVIGVEVDIAAQLLFFMRGATRGPGLDISALGAAPWYFAGGAAGAGAAVTAKFSEEGDGLHPLFVGAVDTYLYPNVIALLRTKMAAFWPN
jgi:hypothetical protein